MSLSVKHMMTKDMVTVRPHATASEVGKIFIDRKFSSIPVVDEKTVHAQVELAKQKQQQPTN